jgi:hypothetical protein
MKASEFFQRAVHIYEPPLRSIVDGLKQLKELGFKPILHLSPSPESLLIPPTAPYTTADLAELSGFYQVIHKAKEDRIARLLVAGPKIQFSKGFNKKIEMVLDELPSDWDLVYFGYTDASFRDVPTKDKLLYQVNYASGLQLIGINNRFYHLFLETARVPVGPLDEHLKRISLPSNIFVINPPLVIPS